MKDKSGTGATAAAAGPSAAAGSPLPDDSAGAIRVPIKVIPAAALALLSELHGPAVICARCTRTVRYSGPCPACGARDTVTLPSPPGGPTPGRPCRHCRTRAPRRTSGLCPRCYTRASRAEDYLFLTGAGVHPDQAAARIGVSRRTIDRDLADFGHRREPARVQPSAAGPATGGGHR